MSDWTLAVVERDGTHVAHLDLLGGSMDLGQSSPHPHRLTATVGPDGIDALIRGRYVTASRDGSPAEWFAATDKPRSLESVSESYALTCIDSTGPLGWAKLRKGITVGRAAFVREAALDLLADYAPLIQVTIGDNDGTLREPLAWSPGTPLIDVLNPVLEAGGMTPILPVADGGLESTPWTAPSERALAATFSTDPDGSPFLPAMTIGDPLMPAPNEWLAITRGTPSIVGRWADEASIAEVGAITEIVPGEVDATDLAAANLIARRYAESSRPRRRLSFVARYEPRARPGAVVAVEWPRWGVHGRYEVISARVTLDRPADTAYELLEV